MSEPVEITVAELREAILLLLDTAERQFGSRVDLDVDQYWCLWPSDAFNAEQPRPLTGSLRDDTEAVRELLHRDDRVEDENLLWHDLHHVVGVLQRIASLAGA